MQEKVLDSIKQHVDGLCGLGVATKEEVAEIMNRITAGDSHPNRRDLLNKKQVAELAKVHPRTIDRWVDEGKLTKRTIGNNSCRFDSKEVELFLFG